MTHFIAPAFLILSLAACQMAPPVSNPAPDRPPPPIADCGAGPDLLGQPESVLAAMTFPMGTRIFRTGDALTMDYSPTRLNIEIGPDGLIVAVTCG
jgi:hypothetical protein